jgi:hypothetical protein
MHAYAFVCIGALFNGILLKMSMKKISAADRMNSDPGILNIFRGDKICSCTFSQSKCQATLIRAVPLTEVAGRGLQECFHQ